MKKVFDSAFKDALRLARQEPHQGKL